MMLAVRLRVPVLLLALLLPLGLVVGCSDEEPEPATGPGLPSQAALTSYFEAIVSGDADKLAKVQTDVAADGSLAQAYAAYNAEFSVAAASVDPDTFTPIKTYKVSDTPTWGQPAVSGNRIFVKNESSLTLFTVE